MRCGLYSVIVSRCRETEKSYLLKDRRKMKQKALPKFCRPGASLLNSGNPEDEHSHWQRHSEQGRTCLPAEQRQPAPTSAKLGHLQDTPSLLPRAKGQLLWSVPCRDTWFQTKPLELRLRPLLGPKSSAWLQGWNAWVNPKV